MNICIIATQYPTVSNPGGISTFNYNLSFLLNKMGHRVFILISKPKLKKNYKFHIKKVKNNRYIAFITHNFNNKILNFFYFIFPFGGIRKILFRFFPDVSHFIEWNLFCLISFRKLQKKFLIDTIHSTEIFIPAFLVKIFYPSIPLIINSMGPTKFLNKFYEPRNISNLKRLNNRLLIFIEYIYVKYLSDIIIASTMQIQKYLKKIAPKKNIIFIRNFINPKDYNISYKTKRTSNNFNNIICIGRQEYRKGSDIVLKSFKNISKKNKKIKLFFIGREDPYKTFSYLGKLISLKELVNKLIKDEEVRKRIIFLDNINGNKELNRFIEKIGGGISVLLSRYEFFGYVLIESILMRLVVITTNKGGTKEVITNRNIGFTINPNIKSLTSTINKILLKKKQYTNMPELAYKTVIDRYVFQSVINKYRFLYTKLFSDNYEKF